MRQFFIILVILLWLLLGWCFYQNKSNCCAAPAPVEEVEEKPVATVAKATRPLLYAWSNQEPILGDNWPAYRDSIVRGHNDNNLLQITGYYRSDEANPTSFENLGVARANDLKQRFVSYIDADKIRLVGKLTDEKAGERENRFPSADFRYLVNTKNVKEVDDKALIYFPYNSTRKLDAADVETYLNDVADRVKSSGETVSLVGHTDSYGDSASNNRLGMMRANVVKEYLMSRGVSASKIQTASRGEASPIASNDTNSGRAKNRRTELTIK